MFILLGLVDLDGRGTGKVDLPPLFAALADVLRPSYWVGELSGPDPLRWLSVSFELVFIALSLVALAFVSAAVGWLLHFMVMPFLPPHGPGDAEARATTVQPLNSPPIGRVRMFLAAYGAGAAVFGAFTSELSGLQFWCLWSSYDRLHRALTGSHVWSSFHSLALLLMVCFLNAVGSALLARRISSPAVGVRLVAILILGIQLSTLALSANILGLRMFW